MSASHIPEVDTYVTGGYYNDSPDRIIIEQNNGQPDVTIDFSGMVKSEMTADFTSGIKIGNHYSEPTASTDIYIPSDISVFSNDVGYLTLATLPPDIDTDVTAVTLTLDGANNLTASVFENGNTIPSAPVSLASLAVDTNTQASVVSSDGSLSVDDTGTNADGETEYDISVDYTAIIETEERSRVLGYANVNADGTLADVFGGATVTVDQTGRRLLVPPTGAESASTTVVESFTTRDSIDSRLEDFIGQAIHITEGDNGTAANVPRDRAFTIQWYGKEEVITGLQATTNQITVPTNTSDLTNDSGFITLADLPPDSDDQTLTLTKEFVDKSYYAVGYLSPTDIHDNGATVNFTSAELDAGWTRVGNTYSYTGSPKAVRVDANIIAEDVGVSNYWAKPRLRITETVSGRIWNFSDLTMQDTGAYDGTSVIDGSLTHVNPPANPSYLLEWFDEDARTATIIPTADSMISFVANDPIEVLTDTTIS